MFYIQGLERRFYRFFKKFCQSVCSEDAKVELAKVVKTRKGLKRGRKRCAFWVLYCRPASSSRLSLLRASKASYFNPLPPPIVRVLYFNQYRQYSIYQRQTTLGQTPAMPFATIACVVYGPTGKSRVRRAVTKSGRANYVTATRSVCL